MGRIVSTQKSQGCREDVRGSALAELMQEQLLSRTYTLVKLERMRLNDYCQYLLSKPI